MATRPDNNPNLPDVTDDVVTPSDDPIERNIQLALEAQDGPTETPNVETPTGNTTEPKEGEAAKPSDSNSDGSDNKSQQPTKQEGSQEERTPSGPKDLTLPDGTVIKGGSERRFYEQREVARQQLSVAQREVQQERARAEKFENELNTLRETTRNLHGAEPETIRLGVQIATDLQRDPVGTMKKLLAEAVAQGYKIEELGAGVDAAAIKRMIEDRIPQQQQEDTLTDEEIQQEAIREVQTFYSQYPDARPHDAVLGRMLRDHPGLDLQTAYFELKNGFAEKGFDFSLSLEDNLKNSVTPTPQTPAAPMPNGRTPVNGAMHETSEVRVAHEDTDMSDIVKAAMREAGLKV